MKRRDVLKKLSLLPIAGSFHALDSILANPEAAAVPFSSYTGSDPNIFRAIGVEPIINCRGVWTVVGGSIVRPEVRNAVMAAFQHFVHLDELAEGIGARLAELTGAEWGMISAGCAAGLKHVTAGIIAGGNPEKLLKIPDLTGIEKNEVILIPSVGSYDHAIRNVGVKIITAASEEELLSSMNSRTAMISLYAHNDRLSLENVVRLAKPRGIPILVDAAAEDLTIPERNLQKGATVVAYSGGKALCGPQDAGMLLGDKRILMSAWQASSPHHGPGRDNKVSHEIMIGMLASVEAWVNFDHEGQWETWHAQLELISKRVLEADKTVKTRVHYPFGPAGLTGRAPELIITWNPDKLKIDREEMAYQLATTTPRIVVNNSPGRGEPMANNGIGIDSQSIALGEEKIIGDRIHEILRQRRSLKSTQMLAPAVTVSGRWDMDMEFYSSKSRHTLILEQDGNWINGTHKGDFRMQELNGTIEGNQIKIQSRLSAPGSTITYFFSGIVSDDTISGMVYMGEYLNAKFKATRYSYRSTREPIADSKVQSGQGGIHHILK